MFEDGEEPQGAVNEGLGIEGEVVENKVDEVKEVFNFNEELKSMNEDERKTACKKILLGEKMLGDLSRLVANEAKTKRGDEKIMYDEFQWHLDNRRKELAEHIAGIDPKTLDKTKGWFEKLGNWAQTNLKELDDKLGNPSNKIKENKWLNAAWNVVKNFFTLIVSLVVTTLKNFEAAGQFAGSILELGKETVEVGKKAGRATMRGAEIMSQKTSDAVDRASAVLGNMTAKIASQRNGASQIIKGGGIS